MSKELAANVVTRASHCRLAIARLLDLSVSEFRTRQAPICYIILLRITCFRINEGAY